MQIEVLTVPDCPNGPVLTERLERVLAGRTDVRVAHHVVTDEAEAVRRGMHGSPTLLLDGIDPFAEPGEPASISCRLYRDADGQAAGVPSLAELRAVLAAADCCTPPSGTDRAVGRAGRGRLAPVERGCRAVHQAVLHSFATTGRAAEPAVLDEAAAGFGLTGAQVLAELAAEDFLTLDASGQIVAAYPFSAVPSDRATGRAVRLEQFTIAYNIIEGVIAVGFGFLAGSIALIGFGFDSWIEVAAASIVLHRLLVEIRDGEPDEVRERRALRFVAITFFVLAAYVVVEGVRDLLTAAHPEASPVGIALTGLSLIVMPLLARAKREAGEAMNSRLVIADAAETQLCALLSVSTFAGLLAYALFGWIWIDPVAGFVIAGFAIKEGREAWEGDLVCDDGCAVDEESN